jgi:hypothetical protein
MLHAVLKGEKICRIAAHFEYDSLFSVAADFWCFGRSSTQARRPEIIGTSRKEITAVG